MDVAASEFYDSKDRTYDLNFKEEVSKAFAGWSDKLLGISKS